MIKRLLIGPAGSGKTHRLLDEFEHSLRHLENPLEENCFFILPSAEHTERVISLIVQRGIPGFFHRRITTLSRLISEIFGIGDENRASNVTRFLILRDIFQKNTFDYFQEVQQSSGFLNLMLSFIAELKESLIPVTAFRERMNHLKKIEPDLAAKYEALAAIYEAYERELASQGLRDRQDALSIYREMKKAGKLRQLRFKKIWLDGFFDFSNMQLEYLRELTAVTDEMTITLTQDKSPSRQNLFEGVNRTEELLAALGFERQYLTAPNQRAKTQVLVDLEKHLFSSVKLKKPFPVTPELKIFESIGLEGEVEMIAREIEKLYRQGGYRFSDFAVLLRQIGSYAEVIRTVFARYALPAEIHEREKLQFSPLLQVVVRLFKIFRDGWKRSDLIAFLKSSYVRKLADTEKQYEWIAELEHWALREGVLQGREEWRSRYAHSSKKLAGKDFFEKKEETLKILCRFEDALRNVKQFPDLKRLILNTLKKDFGIFEIRDSSEEFVRRDAASYKRLEAVLDEIGAFFISHRVEIQFDSFADRFFRLVELDLYSLHQRDKNQVQIYDVSLARQKEYRVVFVAGLLEKGFPVQIKEDPVLSDWERELLNSQNPETPLRQRSERQNVERYLFYLAVTRPSERLYLTYPRLDLEGQESLPSYYVEEVKSLFGESLEIKKQDLAHPYPEIHEALDMRELQIALIGELWNPLKDQGDDLLLGLTGELLSRPESASQIRRAFYDIKTGLTDPRIAQGDFFRSSRTSPTKLEEYAKCQYRFFSNRVLALKDPEEEVNIMRKGSILHQVLEKFFEYWKDHPGEFGNKSKVDALITKELEKALKEYPLVFEKKYQIELEHEELREYLDLFIEEELERLKTSPLKPRYVEFSFGIKGLPGSYPLFVVEDGERKISISGRIDRVDVDAKHEFGLVIDYKRSAQFKKSDLELGIALQLPLYLTVIENYLKLKPVGGELYSIRDREHKGFYHEEIAGLLASGSGRKTHLSEKEFRAIIDRSLQFVKRFNREMANAEISVRPRYCDPFCAYSTVCRIEKWRLPLILEEIKEEDRKEGNPKHEILNPKQI